jgi:voltage-gated potassium channel Kch
MTQIKHEPVELREAPGLGPFRLKIYEVIFEADTPLGKLFDVVLLGAILASVLAVCLDSVATFEQRHHNALIIAEWIFTVLFTVGTIVVVVGAAMYIIEGPENGFTSIPRSMYWGIVTLTTVGYGDIAPKTIGGQILSSLLMIMGYGLIAIPTGIVTAELTGVERKTPVTTRTCSSCLTEGHRRNASYCRHCGEVLELSSGS